MEREEQWRDPYLALDDSKCAKPWPMIGFAVALKKYSMLWSSRDEDEDERRINLTLEPSSTFNQRINFKTCAHSRKPPRRSRAVARMSSSENDSDAPEHVSLSASKRQAIERRKDVAEGLAQAKSKRKEHNRERDRQLKEQSSKQRAALIADSESEDERSTEEGEEAKDPRLLPDHLFAAAFNQSSSISGPSVPKHAPPKTRQRKRKRTDLSPKDRIVG